MKKICLICILVFCSGLRAQDIQGFWKTIDEKTGKPKCIVAIYEYQTNIMDELSAPSMKKES